MNPKIERIEEAEAAIENVTAEKATAREAALQDGIIDATEQADLDRLDAKVEKLRDMVRTLRATVERNRRIWDALASSLADWTEQLIALHEADKPNLDGFDTSETAMKEAVEDQRWADATTELNMTLAAMKPVFAAYQAEAAAGGAGGSVPPPPVPSADPVQDQWDAALATYEKALDALERHAKVAHPHIAGMVTTIKGNEAAAKTMAGSGQMLNAVPILEANIAACATAEDSAHDVAHYDATHTHRAGLVAKNAGSPVGDALVDDLQTEMETLLASAEADDTAGKHKAAIPKLDKISPIFDRRRAMDDKRGAYTSWNTPTQGLATTVNGKPAAERAVIQARLDKANTNLTAAQVGVTKDYTVSAGLLRELNPEFFTLHTLLKEAGIYKTELAKFDTEMALLEPHAGRVVIEEFYQARVVDRAHAEADVKVPNLNAAIKTLQRTKAKDWTDNKAAAAAYVTYTTNSKAAQAQIETVRAMPDTADLIAQADELMARAADQAVAKDVAAAETSLTEALQRATDAQNASQAQSDLGALKDGAALDGAASDFPAALKVYDDMRANVAGKDGTGTFAAALAAADVPVEAAKTSVAGGSPDMADVRAKLDEGIAALEALLPQILAHGHYQSHLATAKTLVDTTLGTVNDDDCIKPAIDACKVLLTEAEDLAKDPTFDFVGAEAKVAEATERGRKAEENGKLYKAGIGKNKADMTAAIASIKAGAAADLMDASVKRLTDLLADITAAMAAEDFTLATVKGNEGATLATSTAQDIALCATIKTEYKTFVTDSLFKVQGGEPEVADALALANKRIGQFDVLMASGSFRTAERMISEINWAIWAGARNLEAANTYKPAQADARAKLDAVAAITNAGVEEPLKALENRYAAAETLAAEPQFATATTKMAEISKEAETLKGTAETFGTYEAARVPAEAKLIEAENHAQIDAIKAVVTLLRTKYDGAVKLATDGAPARAEPLMKEVEESASDAVDNANSAGVLEGINEAIGDAASDAAGPTPAQIADARKAYKLQADKDNAAVASEELAEADNKLGLAENDATADADKTISLRSAMELITKAADVISQHSLLKQEIERARAQVVALRALAQSAYLDTQLSEMEAGIDTVEADAKDLSALQTCSTALEAILAEAVDYRTKLEAHATYGPLRTSAEVEPRLAKLENHSHSYSVQSNIEAMRSKLLEAARLSENFNPVAAVALLEEVKKIGLSAFVLAEMQANKTPSKADIEKILARPGGDAELDAMVDALEPDAQRKVLAVAFEARFGCDLRSINEETGAVLDGDKPGPNIRRFYEIMSDLPPSATIDNDSLRIFRELEKTSAASDYLGGGDKIISMRAGDAEMSIAKTFGAEHEVGVVDEDCEPANKDPVNKFSWSTLHEVGHAVDDQHKFMDKNQSKEEFGGWTVYGGNVDPIAAIVAKHFDFDKTYVSQVMSGRLEVVDSSSVVTTVGDLPPSVPEPKGCSPEEWESRRVNFATWVAQVRTVQKPWSSQSIATKIAIDGIVYHECYKGDWASYPLSARSRGITAYQFRAPGEWFSELYAAYHSGKLKDTHPAAKWLADLDAPAA